MNISSMHMITAPAMLDHCSMLDHRLAQARKSNNTETSAAKISFKEEFGRLMQLMHCNTHNKHTITPHSAQLIPPSWPHHV